jgi:single-strand DNA-binding protein
MASFNRIIMIGNLTKDPDHKQLGSGQSVCRLSIASNRPYRNKQTGEMMQDVCFVDVDVWGQQAESAQQYLRKGAPVLVEGRLKYDTWKDADGGNRHRHSISAERVVFLSTRQEGKFGAAEGEGGAAFGSNGELPSYEAGNETRSAAAPKRGRRNSPGGSEGSNKDGFSFKDQQPFEDDLPF